LFYDLDPKGVKIAETFRKNLKDMERATGWNPDDMIIERFGLNVEQIDKFKLSWIPNLKTSKGRDPKYTKDVKRYIEEIGEKKCEMESLFKNDETLRAAEQICRGAIEKYYGLDAKERFQKKELESKGKLHDVYDSPVWNQLYAELTRIEKALADQEPKKAEATPNLAQEQEVEVIIDGKYYGKCPRCGAQFNYDEEKDSDRLVRCRNCNQAMRLKPAKGAS
jgi:DNA-directed RNA polymerase subunit RPC12/RpoP